MWENPIEIIQTDIQYKVVDEYEKQILKAIQSYGISVNKKELVKALNYDRNQYEKGYADAKAEHRWIPCSERLPVQNGVYVVTRTISDGFEYGNITDCCYFDGTNTWHDDTRVNHGRKYLADVIAWQPLPESYREGEEC